MSLLPGSWDDPISAQLRMISIKPNYPAFPPYEALSFVWEQEPGYRSRILSGRQHSVTTNLFLALRRLWKLSEVQTLWVDALCID